MIEARDTEALLKHVGNRVIVMGTIKSAEWSATGKVMNIQFEGSDENKGLLAVVFESQKQRFDRAWHGDFRAAVTGKRVRLYGELQEYGGYDEAWKGRAQMILAAPEQVTLPAGPSDGESE